MQDDPEGLHGAHTNGGGGSDHRGSPGVKRSRSRSPRSTGQTGHEDTKGPMSPGGSGSTTAPTTTEPKQHCLFEIMVGRSPTSAALRDHSSARRLDRGAWSPFWSTRSTSPNSRSSATAIVAEFGRVGVQRRCREEWLAPRPRSPGSPGGHVSPAAAGGSAPERSAADDARDARALQPVWHWFRPRHHDRHRGRPLHRRPPL